MEVDLIFDRGRDLIDIIVYFLLTTSNTLQIVYKQSLSDMWSFQLDGFLWFLKSEQNIRLPVIYWFENLDRLPIISPQREKE